MKKIIYFLIIIAFACNSYAQTDTLRLSVLEAAQLGISHRFDAKADSLNITIAENDLNKSKKELLPNLDANGKFTYNIQLQPSIIPAGYLGFTEPEKIAIGMKNNTAFALDLTYNIFKPGLYTDIKIAKNNLVLEKEKNHKTTTDIKFEITESYYNVLLKYLQYVIARQDEQRYKAYYDLTSGQLNNGAIIESDALQSELDYKNSQMNTKQQTQNYLLSQQFLKYKINVPLQTVLILTDSMETIEQSKKMVDTSSSVASNRSEIKQLIIKQDGNTLLLRKARQNYLPSISLFANYTQLYQGPNFNYSNNFYWAPINYIGFKLSIPLTGTIKNINSVKEYKFKISQTDFNLKQKTADVTYEIQQVDNVIPEIPPEIF